MLKCGPSLNLNSIHILRYCPFLLKFWQFTQKCLLPFYGFSIGYVWGQTNFEKTPPKEFFDVFECETVDLTAEIKITENVLSLLGAQYVFWNFNTTGQSWIQIIIEARDIAAEMAGMQLSWYSVFSRLWKPLKIACSMN